MLVPKCPLGSTVLFKGVAIRSLGYGWSLVGGFGSTAGSRKWQLKLVKHIDDNDIHSPTLIIIVLPHMYGITHVL